MLILKWSKCKGDIWCQLDKLDIEHKNLKGVEGVYVLWAGEGNSISVVRVGYGNIAKEFKRNKEDRAIIPFLAKGLKASWAEVPFLKRKGIVAYLTKKCSPKIPDTFSDASPIEVNLPWE